jgi:AcrR family transcriptional regulator
LSNKELQRKRTLIYFIEAAQEIMNEEGISNITIRKVAKRAGYNSATLYNYFDDLDHLILYASLKYLHLYNADLIKKLPLCSNERERSLQMWRSFCQVSFLHPEPFERIFFCKYSTQLESIYKKYYLLFPEELKAPSNDLDPIFLSVSLSNRNKMALELLFHEENIPETNLSVINDLMLSAYHELLHQCAASHPPDDLTVQQYTDKMFTYIDYLLYFPKTEGVSHE